ncbi:hypothetical protein BCE_3858 [Bacillus cereus ATCC 10987]|uniref:Uncharacterized protein n=1 Tax=Bacillus cereus (strain ATCC 10987 / NRS 248) TaxID=222523 RepID=Q732Q2_BACC1|nr:hypothetical protein BCE_3858 [Bacillus cereus ATCC 10987]
MHFDDDGMWKGRCYNTFYESGSSAVVPLDEMPKMTE